MHLRSGTSIRIQVYGKRGRRIGIQLMLLLEFTNDFSNHQSIPNSAEEQEGKQERIWESLQSHKSKGITSHGKSRK
jgi:hypothetical protein